jgi:hypothetical protein
VNESHHKLIRRPPRTGGIGRCWAGSAPVRGAADRSAFGFLCHRHGSRIQGARSRQPIHPVEQLAHRSVFPNSMSPCRRNPARTEGRGNATRRSHAGASAAARASASAIHARQPASRACGVGRGARAAGDGYTLVVGGWDTFVANGAVYALRYNLLDDFLPIALVATQPLLIVAKKAVPVNDLKGFLAWLKDNQDKTSAGTAGVGSVHHVAAIYFQNRTDTRFGLVPYRGGAPALQDLVAGQIDLIISPAADAIELIRAGTIKVLAVMAKNRLAAAPAAKRLCPRA